VGKVIMPSSMGKERSIIFIVIFSAGL
jgi:hypothetical protein